MRLSRTRPHLAAALLVWALLTPGEAVAAEVPDAPPPPVPVELPASLAQPPLLPTLPTKIGFFAYTGGAALLHLSS